MGALHPEAVSVEKFAFLQDLAKLYTFVIANYVRISQLTDAFCDGHLVIIPQLCLQQGHIGNL